MNSDNEWEPDPKFVGPVAIGLGQSGWKPDRAPLLLSEPMTMEATTQRHEIVRPFRTSLLAGLGFAVAAGVVLVVAFLLAFLLLHVAGGNSTPAVPSGVTSQTCPDGVAPTSQDGGLICDDGSLPTSAGWYQQ